MGPFVAAALVVMTTLIATGSAWAQDAAAGEKVFQQQCRSCHQIGEGARNAAGPALNGLLGRKAGTIPGYSYSEANRNSEIVWDETTFGEYIKQPKVKIPGTKKAYGGLKDEQKAADLLAYIKQF